jgi:inositol 1,4,5-triphosphate receptor type 1
MTHHEIKENYHYEMKMKHQHIMQGRASNGYVIVEERLDFYNDPWNSSRLDDSTTTTLSSVNSTLEDLMRQQQPKSVQTLLT